MLAFVAALSGRAEVFYDPPPGFVEELAPRLTPISDVLSWRYESGDDDAPGAVLLSEQLQRVEPDGRRLIVRHVAYQTLTEAGVRSNAEDLFSYRRGFQRLYVILAETIQQDGTTQPVRANAILEQSPQRQAQYAIYDDQAEVRIIYPNVQPGSVTHAIIAIEDIKVRMPGEYMHTFIWGSYWPSERYRLSIDLPSELVHRLQIQGLGTGLPQLQRELIENGGERLSWEVRHAPKLRYEVNRAPDEQVGPVIAMSTVQSWEDVGRWFLGLQEGRDQLTPEMQAEVDAFTADLSTRDEIIRKLFDVVANDVRYTGLELGEADYQPHAVGEVWANRYGDCKDKALLLAAFLRHKGIGASVALVNTEHAGWIDRRLPSYRVFDHAITAIADGEGGYLFCDPTIAQGEPGVLGPGSAGREVLVATGDRTSWIRTPDHTAGTLRYDFNLSLDAAGALSGWLDVYSEGYYSASYRERFRNFDRDAARDSLTESVRQFYPAAEVIDIEAPQSAPGTPAHQRAYFIVNAASEANGGATALHFPWSQSLAINPGTSAERETPRFLWRDDITVNVRVDLPAGLVAQVLPEELQVEYPGNHAIGRWRVEGSTCIASLQVRAEQTIVPVAEYAQLYQAVQAMQAWLDRAAVFRRDDTGGAVVQSTESAELNFPLMPTAEGQLDLAERLYPSNGNRNLRRAALQRVLQYFPHDRSVQFRAGARIAQMYWEDDDNQVALDRILPLLAAYRQDVAPDTYAWGEVLQALMLRDLKRRDEAVDILLRLARDAKLPTNRRAWAAIDAVKVSDSLSPDEMTELFAELASLGSDERPALNITLARMALRAGKTELLREQWTRLRAEVPDQFPIIMTAVIDGAAGWTGEKSVEHRSAVMDLMVELAPSPSVELQAALDRISLVNQREALAALVRERLEARLAVSPLNAWWDRRPLEVLESAERHREAAKAAEDANDSDLGFRHELMALLHFSADDQFPYTLRLAAGFADWHERTKGREEPSELLGVLLDLCDRLPPTDDSYLEARFLRARRLSRSGDAHSERAVYEALLARDGLPTRFRIPCATRLGESFEADRQFVEAARHYETLASHMNEYASAVDAVVRALVIRMHEGEWEQAQSLLGLLANAPEAVVKEAAAPAVIGELVMLNNSGQARAYWQAAAAWWPQWEKLAAETQVSLDDVATVIPLIPDLTAYGQEVGAALQNKNPASVWASLSRAISAARWLPSLGAEIGALNAHVTSVQPRHAVALRRLTIAILQRPEPPGLPGWQTRRVQLAAHLFDDAQLEPAFVALAEARADPPSDPSIRRALNRVWVLVATAGDRELDDAVAALEADLASGSDRHVARLSEVTILANALRKGGRNADEAALLERELSHPEIVSNPSAVTSLNDRLKLVGDSRAFAEAVAAWIKDYAPGWYAYAAPHDRLDPGMRDLASRPEEAVNRFPFPSAAKACLLVAQDPEITPELQLKAWEQAWWMLVDLVPDDRTLRESVLPLMNAEGLDDAARRAVLTPVLVACSNHEWFELHDELRALEAGRALEGEWITLLDHWRSTDLTSSAAVASLVRELASAELSTPAIRRCVIAVGKLIELGALSDADALIAEASQWRLSPQSNDTTQTLRLELLQMIGKARARAPIHQAMLERARCVLASREPSDLPARSGLLRRGEFLQRPDPAEDLVGCVRQVHSGIFERGDFRFWTRLIGDLAHVEGGAADAFEILEAGFASADDDALLAELITGVSTAADIDDPWSRDRLLSLLAPLRTSKVLGPRAGGGLLLLDTHLALRQGKPIDPDNAAAALRDASWQSSFRNASLRHWLQRDDRLRIARVLEQTPTAELLSQFVAPLAMEAYQRLERTAEAQLARETVRDALRAMIAHGWATHNEHTLHLALPIALRFGDPGMVPDTFVNEMVNRSPSRYLALVARIARGWLKEDWDEVDTAGTEFLRLYPNHHDWKYHVGVARSKLGRNAGAVEALEDFVRYCCDSLYHPEAADLLHRLKS